MKSKMFLVVLSFLLINTAVFSAQPQISQGSKALFFGFTGLSELKVDNSVLGAQYLFADKMGIWAEINFKILNDKPVKDGEEYATNKMGLNLGYIYYAFNKGPVAFYVSPQFGFASSSTETAGTLSKKKTVKDSDFYLGCSIGAEWWLFDNVSLAVSTLIGFDSCTQTTEDGSISLESKTTNIGFISSNSGKFLLSFYF